MRPILLLPALLVAIAAPAAASPEADEAWRQASLIPINEFAHPRRHGQMPAAIPQPTPTPQAAIAEPSPTPTPGLTMDLDAIGPEEGSDVVRPRFALGAFWPIPAAGLPATQPAPDLELSLWQGTWGVSAGTTLFGAAYLPGRATPYLQANTPLTSVLLKQRSVEDPYDRENPAAPVKPHTELWVGYRGLGLADVNFAAAGGAFTLPIGLRDLTFKGSGLGALAPSGAFCLDGRLGFGLRSGALEAELGLRDVYLVVAGQPALNMWGPQASIGATF